MLLAIVLAVLGASEGRAQAPPPDGPAFEVATVRPSTSGETRRQIEVLPGGRFNAVNMTLWQILSIAYPIEGKFRDEIDLTGGPGWITSDRFDIVAKADGSPGLAVERVRLMLRRFLVERFKLQLHHETRRAPYRDNSLRVESEI